MPDCSVHLKSWSELTTDELYDFLKLRTDIFFLEQNVDETELDDRDQEEATEHLWMTDAAGVAAYLRVLFDDHPEHLDAHRLVGRVVVRADRRGQGLARMLLEHVVARHGHEALLLHAQHYVAPLYAAVGFQPVGEIYIEASIPHLTMYRAGSASPALRGEDAADRI